MCKSHGQIPALDGHQMLKVDLFWPKPLQESDLAIYVVHPEAHGLPQTIYSCISQVYKCVALQCARVMANSSIGWSSNDQGRFVLA